MTKNQKIQWGLLGIVVLWFAGSVAMSRAGLFDQPNQPPTYFGVFLGGPIMLFLLVYLMSKSLREALLAVPLWVVVAIHSLRFVGIFFVINVLTHALPPQFGWSAGVGDIISAIVSIPLAIALHKGHRSKGLRARYIVWNFFGLADLFTAVTLGLLYSVSVVGVLSRPGLDSRALSFMPLSLIPTFYVPILILLHFLALRRSKEVLASR
jgi:hypothetical protein